MVRISLTLLLCVLALSRVHGRENIGAYRSIMQLRQLALEPMMQLDSNIVQRYQQLRHLAVEFFDYYQNITAMDLIVSNTRIPNQQDLQCLAEIDVVSRAIASGSVWALRMIDSWGSLPSGILLGNLKDMGNFDECLRVNYAMEKTGQDLRGKYCYAKIITGDQLGISPILSVKTAVCFPASCNGEHIDTLLRQLLKHLLNIEINADMNLINDNKCQTAERESLDGLTIFTIVFLSVLGTVLVGCTLYDYCLCVDQKQLPVLVKVFSARANSRALFRVVDSKSNSNVIDCLHGIRCMSLIWVIYGHDYMFAYLDPNINTLDVISWYRSPFSMFIMHALFSVDTFFFLSGLLLVLVALRSMDRTKGKINVPMMYLHRYLRLTPIVAIAILVYMKILPLMGNGPDFDGKVADTSETCQDTWFWTLLYVQNYATKSLCLGHTWYLGVDMQLYIISPILLIALYKWGKKAVAGIVVLMLLLASCLFSMMVIKHYSLNDLSSNINKIYFSTHTRASPWIIGLIFGYYLHVNQGKSFKLKRITVWLGWLISLALIFTCLFAIYPYPANAKHLPILNEAFYVTLTRIAWPLALVWLVFACKYGYGGLANSFLSSPMWQPLSKLSYCAYIFHLFIETLNHSIIRTNTYFSDYQVMLGFWADFGFTILMAYFMYILVEAPFGGLEMLLLPARRPSPLQTSAAPIQTKLVKPDLNQENMENAPQLETKTPSTS